MMMTTMNRLVKEVVIFASSVSPILSPHYEGSGLATNVRKVEHGGYLRGTVWCDVQFRISWKSLYFHSGVISIARSLDASMHHIY
jgi:hypothetical protein